MVLALHRLVSAPRWWAWLWVLILTATRVSVADEFPKVENVEAQPLAAATERLIEALDYVGAPLSQSDRDDLQRAINEPDARKSSLAIQKILDPLCVVGVTINAESRVSVVEGPAKKELIQQGWRTFLVKVHNQAGINPELKIESPNLAPLFKRSTGRPDPQIDVKPTDVPQRWLDGTLFNAQPLKPRLSGLLLEYRIIQLYSREVGKREAKLGFNVGQGTQDIGFRNAVPILFQCLPAVEVALKVRDFDGKPTTAAFVIRDKYGRVYPNPARRLAPDFFFHNQIYRSDGESIHLPPGEYNIEVARGPEYLVENHKLIVRENIVSQPAEFQLHRWIHPADRRWFSGDHHVHAAGCAHYENPTEGVTPADMMRHILGEDLNVGCVLSWGPCWYAQKQYFEGKTSALSRPNYLMRYDVEVSGFPSSHAGHLCLLRLTEDDYPGTELIEQWPSWTQPVLEWGQKQKGVVGYSHSGWGLQLPDVMPDGSRQMVDYNRLPAGWIGKAADKLPDYAMPRFDGIGANEYIVTTANGACDFISAVDTPVIWELNIWYHTLNCGMTSRISGETDFPCIYGDKVGLGRIYVKLDPTEELNYDNWVQGLKDGRSYCGDGLSHILDFRVDKVAVGEAGTGGQISTLKIDKPGTVKVSFDVAAFLANEKPTPETEAIRNRRLDQKPYWHLERARQGDTRDVPVEVIVNGVPVATRKVTADGRVGHMDFDVPIKKSSWVAVRIFPSVHTNPVWVEVGGQPVRASKKSADWCIEAVSTCWKAKVGSIRAAERDAAKAAYDRAKEIYTAVAQQATDD
ncbi:MAG: CehA/McbA family metallohydrolase [Planctomycetes bacterium]|nr:CehA/McbA family metallohydrolase [Planctomycetota bacterium]